MFWSYKIYSMSMRPKCHPINSLGVITPVMPLIKLPLEARRLKSTPYKLIINTPSVWSFSCICLVTRWYIRANATDSPPRLASLTHTLAQPPFQYHLKLRSLRIAFIASACYPLPTAKYRPHNLASKSTNGLQQTFPGLSRISRSLGVE